MSELNNDINSKLIRPLKRHLEYNRNKGLRLLREKCNQMHKLGDIETLILLLELGVEYNDFDCINGLLMVYENITPNEEKKLETLKKGVELGDESSLIELTLYYGKTKNDIEQFIFYVKKSLDNKIFNIINIIFNVIKHHNYDEEKILYLKNELIKYFDENNLIIWKDLFIFMLKAYNKNKSLINVKEALLKFVNMIKSFEGLKNKDFKKLKYSKKDVSYFLSMCEDIKK